MPAPSSRRLLSSAGRASFRACSARPQLPAAASCGSPLAQARSCAGSSSAARRETESPPWPSKTPNIAKASSGGPRPRTTRVASSMAGRQPCISAEAHGRIPAPPLRVDFSRFGPGPGPGTSTTARSLAPSLPLPLPLHLPLPLSLPLALPAPASGFSIVFWTRPFSQLSLNGTMAGLIVTCGGSSSASSCSASSTMHTSSAPTPFPSAYAKNDTLAPP
mmetsp:Transcript_66222/g.205349  ORF Transcript_66222/g.205349 Transcript_66222/m.205349 type:complete len:219 (+) Transcript_66222:159-815(+)